MSGSKKFGAFGGVFTPSILTILGVIMYMRLGWVVGNAGLIGTILIILIAHVISVATGLSVSAIATDRKVGAGGVYYVLSRSLGLPMGGSIGITLFIATALSIALYLVGFAESFNAYFGFDTSINGIRLTGSLALLALVTLALISTAIAIKTQFLIMGAILISLIAVFFGSSSYVPESVNLFPTSGSVSMVEVFAIFFPAVTGFTAGIAMSGDLKNPKKSIPSGTIAAIAVGLVIYIGLAVFMAYAVDSETLKSDYNIMMKIALFAPAVVAGIWGATLSSALGGILGGPRILQAMSIDQITPKIFAKGKGKDNEPINALLITFLIAEGGILIGELDVIAGIVSMFYLSAYGFINLAFYLESWASSDFSPTFKVKRWVGLLGAIATFIVMFKLDMISMFASFLIIGVIYYFLAKREVSLGTGDIWQSVWSRLIKTGLRKMDSSNDHNRNWKPNILLFSGGTSNRPHLIEFSKTISGRHGIVTNFDLIENKEANVLFPKHKQSFSDPIIEKYGIFGRRQEVKNVFKGIEAISSTYGFNGVEPNTVFMGWAKNTKDPIWFSQMTQRLIDLDYNVLYLDYDEKRKFGDYKRIDIWWRDLTSTADLSLHLARFLKASEKWNEADIRIIYVNESLKEGYERIIHEKLDEFRVVADVHVINNSVQQKPYTDLVESYSMEADLLLLDIPNFNEGEEKEFVSKTNEILLKLSSTLLLKSSTSLGSSSEKPKVIVQRNVDLEVQPEIILNKVSDQQATALGNQFHLSLTGNNHELIDKTIMSWINNSEHLIQHFIESCDSSQKKEEKENELFDFYAFLEKCQVEIENYSKNDLAYLEERLSSSFKGIVSNVPLHYKGIPTSYKRNVLEEELILNEKDSNSLKKEKQRRLALKKFKLKGQIQVPAAKMARFHVEHSYLKEMVSFQNKIGLAGTILLNAINESMNELTLLARTTDVDMQLDTVEIKLRLTKLMDLISRLGVDLIRGHKDIVTATTNAFLNDLMTLEIKKRTRYIQSLSAKNVKADKQDLLSFSQYWLQNQREFLNQSSLNISLAKLKFLFEDFKTQELHAIETNSQKAIQKLINKAEKTLLSGEYDSTHELEDTTVESLSHVELYKTFEPILLKEIHGLKDLVQVISSDSMEEFELFQRERVDHIVINPKELCQLVAESDFFNPMQRYFLERGNVIERLLKKGKSVLQSSQLAISKADDSIDEETKDVLLSALKELKHEFERDFDKSKLQLEDIVGTVNSKLTVSYIASNSELIIISNQAEKRRNKFSKIFEKPKAYFNDRWNKIQSYLKLKKQENSYKEFIEGAKDMEVNAMNYSDYTSYFNPKLKGHNLPKLYSQLFAGDHQGRIDLMTNRDKELLLAKELLNRSKINGGIIGIVGPPQSGKSFFVEALEETIDNKTYTITPYVTGNVSEADFLNKLRVEIPMLGKNKSLTFPPNSTVVLEDIEGWFEPTTNGWAIIQRVCDMVDNAENVQIIFTTTARAYTQLQKHKGFKGLISGVVLMSPFTADQIESVLLDRHYSGNIELYFEDKLIEDLSSRTKKRVFEKIKDITNGNIGMALRFWRSSIHFIDDQYLLKIPENFAFPKIENALQESLLKQLCIYPYISNEGLVRIYGKAVNEDILEGMKNLQLGGFVDAVEGGFILRQNLIGFVDFNLKK